jgi:hypothetical protein
LGIAVRNSIEAITMTTVTEKTSAEKAAALRAKIASMTETEKEAFVDQVFAEEHPSKERLEQFYAMMLGGLSETK